MVTKESTKNFIITLTGPSGCGKSYVMSRILELPALLRNDGLTFCPVIMPKYVTRPMRRQEIQAVLENKTIDIISVDSIPADCDLIYQTYGKQYALHSRDLRSALEEGKCPVVVINDVRVLEEIKRTFPNQVLSLYLFREVPRKEAFYKEAIIRGGGATTEIEERFEKATAIYHTYIENIGIFNRVILNVGNINTPDFAQIQVYNLIKSILCGGVSLESKQDGNAKLFILSGNAKSGKDIIIKAVDTMGSLQADIIPKYTSRRQNPDDGNDMICRLIPSRSKMETFRYEYKSDVALIDERYKFWKEKTRNDHNNIEELTDELEQYMSSRRNIKGPRERFWDALCEEEKRFADNLRNQIVNEVNEKHILDSYLYKMSLKELRDLYCKPGYHREGIDAVAVSASWEDQQFVDALLNETAVENDVTFEKLQKITKLQDLLTLYQRDGYHKEGVNPYGPESELKAIEEAFFEENQKYIDLVGLFNRHNSSREKKERPQKLNEQDSACYILDNNTGYILYENNGTYYGFVVSREGEKPIYSRLRVQKKHLLLSISLPEIITWLKRFTKENVVSVFAYSEISVASFEDAFRRDPVFRWQGGYREIMKYSENIAYYDHVTIFSESMLKEKPNARDEELIDQVFRLFRYYGCK